MLHSYQIKEKNLSSEYFDACYVPGYDGSFWFGGLANKLSLQSSPNKADVCRLLERNIIGKWTTGRPSLSNGTHLTFSAPKGVSIAALICGDERLISAHESAVAVTINYIAKQMGYRVTKDKVTTFHSSSNVVGAVFHRVVSRSEDPHLHSHVILFNICERTDGIYCALDVPVLLYGTQFIGMVYRNELARNLDAISIRYDWNDGLLDLTKIEKKIVEMFSNRAQQIKKMLHADGIENKDTSQKHIRAVAQVTAPRLSTKVFSEYQTIWRTKWNSWSQYKVHSCSKENSNESSKLVGDPEYLFHSIGLLSKDRSGVNKNKLMTHLLEVYRGGFSIDELDDFVSLYIEQGDLVEDGQPLQLFTLIGYEEFKKQKAELSAITQKEQQNVHRLKNEAKQHVEFTESLRVRFTFAEANMIKDKSQSVKSSTTALIRASVDKFNNIGEIVKHSQTSKKNRNSIAKIRVSTRQKFVIKSLAEQLNLTISDVVRGATLHYLHQI